MKVCRFARLFLLKLLGSVDEVGVGFFFGCLCLVSVE